MPMPTFSWDLPLETRDGDPAELVSILPGVIEGNRPVIARVLRNGASAWTVHTYRTDGTRDGGSSANGLDLVNKVDKLELWLNVRPVDGAFATMGIAYPTRVLADQNSMSDRTACVRVTYVAGEGLENGAPSKVETHELSIEEIGVVKVVRPIYTPADLDKALLAERERCAKIVEDHGRKNREYKQEINVARAELALMAAHNIRNPAGAAEVDLRNVSSLEIKTEVPRAAATAIYEAGWKNALNAMLDRMSTKPNVVVGVGWVRDALITLRTDIKAQWPVVWGSAHDHARRHSAFLDEMAKGSEATDWPTVPGLFAVHPVSPYVAKPHERAAKEQQWRILGIARDNARSEGWNQAIQAAIDETVKWHHTSKGNLDVDALVDRLAKLRRPDLQEPVKVDPYEYSAALQEVTKRRVEGNPLLTSLDVQVWNGAVDLVLAKIDEWSFRGFHTKEDCDAVEALVKDIRGMRKFDNETVVLAQPKADYGQGWNDAIGAVNVMFLNRETTSKMGGQKRLVSREDVVALRRPDPLQDPNVHPLVHAAAACARNEKPQDPIGDIAIAVKIGWNDALDAAIVKLNAWGHVFTRQAFADTLSAMRYPVENQAYRQPRPELLHALRDMGLRLTRSAVARDQQPPLPIQETKQPSATPLDTAQWLTTIPTQGPPTVDLIAYTNGWNDALNRAHALTESIIVDRQPRSILMVHKIDLMNAIVMEIKPVPHREIVGKSSQPVVCSENNSPNAQTQVTRGQVVAFANAAWLLTIQYACGVLHDENCQQNAELIRIKASTVVRDKVLRGLVKQTLEEWHAAADR